MIEKIKVFVVKRFDLIFMGMLFLSLLVKHWLSLAYLFSSTGYFFDFTGYFRNFKIIYLFSPLAVIVFFRVEAVYMRTGFQRVFHGMYHNRFCLCSGVLQPTLLYLGDPFCQQQKRGARFHYQFAVVDRSALFG